MISTIGIVSLSSGIMGEDFIKFEVEIGLRRLHEYGLNVKFMPNALRGLNYIKEHPEKRAEDLLQAFRDPEIDMILCAIGGDDTFRLLPYLFDHNELQDAVSRKIFLGFSDTTINHFMLQKVGLCTFYGQSFLADICELGPQMLSYSRKYFEELISTGRIREIVPSETWYEERKSFGPDQIGKERRSHPDRGFELLQGHPVFPGRFLEAVLTLCMIFLTGSGMLICLYFVRNITCSQIWRIGKIVSCSWNPVRKKCLRRSIGRHWSISRERACLMLCLVSWWVNLWMKPMHRSTNST